VKICDVLSYIHAEGIVYRDLKPDNVIIKSDGSIKLIDFGIARVYKRGKLKDTVIMGTPGYAAPEQYGTSQTDQRSDIYSLGALMHHIVTGGDPREKPFDFDPPSSMGVKISPYLENIVMKALSMKPDQRYQNAGEMKFALEAVLSEMTPLSPLVTEKLEKEVKGRKRKRDGDETQEENEEKKQRNKGGLAGKINIPFYVVIFIALIGLMFRVRFRIWILIPYFLIAWVIVILIYRLWGGHKPKTGEDKPAKKNE